MFLRGALAQGNAGLAAGIESEPARRPGLQARAVPCHLERLIREAVAAITESAPASLVETEEQLGVGAVAQLSDGAAFHLRQLDAQLDLTQGGERDGEHRRFRVDLDATVRIAE